MNEQGGTPTVPPVPPMAPMSPPVPRRRIPWRSYVVVAIVAFVLGILWANRPHPAELLFGGSGRGEDEYPRLRERWSMGSGTTKVVRIAVDGVLFREPSDGWFVREDPVESILRQIRAATQDPAVHGLILEISSPGGAVTPCDEIHRAICAFRERQPGRQVVASVREMAASGGYYIACAADWIVAEPTAIVGSIGVVLQSLNWHELSRKLGVDSTTVKAGENKDLLNPFRPVDSNDVRIVQQVVDEMHQRFRDLVRQGRRMNEEEVRAVADGSIFTAAVGKEKKLVDELGYFEDAVQRIAERLGVSEVRVVRYQTSLSPFSQLFGAEVSSLWRRARAWAGPRLMMIWDL
jgi:protease-4